MAEPHMHGYSESPTVLLYLSNTTIYYYYNDIYLFW